MAKPKSRCYTARELEQHVQRIVKGDPNAPVQIGVCIICGARILTFKREQIVPCPRCTAETSVLPITVAVQQ